MLCSLVCDVVIAGGTEERHVELRQHRVHVIPLSTKLRLVVTVPFDEVAHIDHELRLQEVELIHGQFEGALRVGTPGTVTDDDELELFRVVLKILGRPGLR